MFFVLPVGGTSTFLQISGWHGALGGIAFIDGQSLDINSSGHRPSQFSNNVRHTALIKVRVEGETAKIDALLDGEPHIHWTGKQSSLTPEPAASLPDPRRPAVGGMHETFVFTSIKIRPVSGKIAVLSPRASN